jgi:hypothetical protein
MTAEVNNILGRVDAEGDTAAAKTDTYTLRATLATHIAAHELVQAYLRPMPM